MGILLFIRNSIHGKSESTLLSQRLSPVNIRPKASAKLAFSIQVSTFNIRVFISCNKIAHWYKNGSLLQEKKNLICCFLCGVILSDWEELLSPFLQHSILSPTCIYVQQVKENQRVCNKYKNSERLFPIYRKG